MQIAKDLTFIDTFFSESQIVDFVNHTCIAGDMKIEDFLVRRGYNDIQINAFRGFIYIDCVKNGW